MLLSATTVALSAYCRIQPKPVSTLAKHPKKSSRRRNRIRIGLVSFWLAFFSVVFLNMQARGLSKEVLDSDESVRVTVTGKLIEFTPVVDTMGTGLIFYPGALVEPKAYAPLARSVAEAGYPVTIIFIPLRLAPLKRHRDELQSRTQSVIGANAGRKWILGGHSKGGARASSYAKRRPGDLDGLLLVGTSHPREDNLSGLVIDVTKVYGSEDGLASVEEVQQYAKNLPPSTTFVKIEGGNHSQFGYYGWQFGSGRALISRNEQQRKTIEAVLAQLRRVSDR